MILNTMWFFCGTFVAFLLIMVFALVTKDKRKPAYLPYGFLLIKGKNGYVSIGTILEVVGDCWICEYDPRIIKYSEDVYQFALGTNFGITWEGEGAISTYLQESGRIKVRFTPIQDIDNDNIEV